MYSERTIRRLNSYFYHPIAIKRPVRFPFIQLLAEQPQNKYHQPTHLQLSASQPTDIIYEFKMAFPASHHIQRVLFCCVSILFIAYPTVAQWSDASTAQYDENGCDRSYANDYGRTYKYNLQSYNPYEPYSQTPYNPDDQNAADEYFAIQYEQYRLKMNETDSQYANYMQYEDQYNQEQQAKYALYSQTYQDYDNYQPYAAYNGYNRYDQNTTEENYNGNYTFDGLSFEQWKYAQLLNNSHREQHYFLYESGAGCKSDNNYNLAFEYFHVDCGATGKCSVGQPFTIRGRCTYLRARISTDEL